MDSSDTDEDLEVINLLDFGDDGEESESSISDLRNGNNNSQIATQEYEILTTSDLIHKMQIEIEKIKSIMVVNGPIARCLLNHYKWNLDELVNNYYDSDDLDAFFQSMGVDNPASVMAIDPVDPVTDCKICYAPFEEVDGTTSFLCGHQFCEFCCGRYFQAKVKNDGEGNRIKCPDPDCKMLIEDATVLKLIPENVRHQFEVLITRTFVSSNPFLRYCQALGCEFAIKANKLEPLLVVCKCGFESCLQCGEIWHDSIACALLKNWIKSFIEDCESAQWMEKNAKRCPRCAVNIEKNGGCNHMKCKACNFSFCWLCMADWSEHGNCNQFQQKNQSNNDRMLHYSIRYRNHIRSLQLERGIYNSVESRMLQLQGLDDLTKTEVLFLKRAVESLRRSRQILISSYVFAYYAMPSNQLSIFEGNQRDLELATENLSWLLEQDITTGRMCDLKQKLQDKYTYCDKRRSVLLDHINEGYEKGYWKLPNN